jgi:hypothetical protein
MGQHPLVNLSIRGGTVRQPSVGYILACDPGLEERGIPHAKQFKWNAGTLTEGALNFNAYSCCLVSVPETALVMLAGFGEYGITTHHAKLAGNIFGDQARRERYGAFRVVTAIGGKAYAAGLRGMVYMLDDIVKWVPIDRGLPNSFDIAALDGFDGSDIYAAGYHGALWHFDGRDWSELDAPTNGNLTAVKCAGDGNVYAAGYDGVLIRGRGRMWDVIATDQVLENIWDLDWFEGELYASSMSFLYVLKKTQLELVNFDEDQPDTCYHLSTATGVMWSIGARDIMSFDGRMWTRIV